MYLKSNVSPVLFKGGTDWLKDLKHLVDKTRELSYLTIGVGLVGHASHI